MVLVVKNPPANAGDAGDSGDLGSIPRLGKSPGEGNTHSSIVRASLVAQMVKNLPTVWETWV